MTIPIPTNLNLSLNIQFDNSCNNMMCCLGGKNPDSAKSVTFHSIGQDVVLPADQALVVKEKNGQKFLTKEPKGLLPLTKATSHREAVITYYDDLNQAHDPKIIAIVAAWKNIDFIQMVQAADPLKMRHVHEMNDALLKLHNSESNLIKAANTISQVGQVLKNNKKSGEEKAGLFEQIQDYDQISGIFKSKDILRLCAKVDAIPVTLNEYIERVSQNTITPITHEEATQIIQIALGVNSDLGNEVIREEIEILESV